MNFIQTSILRTKLAIHEMRRLVAIAKKRKREQEEKESAALELLIDDVCAETGLQCTPENLPHIGLFVEQILKDRAKQREEHDDWDGDSWPPL